MSEFLVRVVSVAEKSHSRARALTQLVYAQDTSSGTVDSKKEDFRKYLQDTGVTQALTSSLVDLYEEAERPKNALDYVCRHMQQSQGGIPPARRVQELEDENERLREHIRILEGASKKAG